LACKAIRDTYGTLYRVPAFEPAPPNRTKLTARPNVDVWWDRDPKNKSDEDLIIRQDNGDKADVVIITLGQLYDLIEALNGAVEHT
jgi:hypothetical protein